MMSHSETEQDDNNKGFKHLATLSLAAIGIVYGDIGTSPIYAFRESFHEDYGLATTPDNILGVLSLIFWALILVISIKYLAFVLRADIKGEGGVLVLTALISPKGKPSKIRQWMIIAGLFGAALLYGDGMITPAISVLSAIEGLKVATPVFEPYVIPITIGIIFALFFFQKHGTGGLGKVFGPITTLWFTSIAILGISKILGSPEVFRALNPAYAVDFFARNGTSGFLVLGSVFLVVTGGEALYADIGHFGVLPIRLTWFGLVLPALLLNYFGQGALLLQNPEAVHNPFFLMGPSWALYPLVIIATMATIIASQAVISGVFSLTRQAVQFGYLPRMKVEQTSEKEYGQIYMPGINWIMMLACIGLVLGFGSSSDLAAAYGVGVTTTMVVTTLLFAVVLHKKWKWNLLSTVILSIGFLCIDLAFWGANMVKVPDGGWFPLLIAGIIIILMTTWKRGRQILADHLRSSQLPLEKFMNNLPDYAETEQENIEEVEGTAIYMYSNPEGTPPALHNNIKFNKVLHETVIILSVKLDEDKPYMPRDEQFEIEQLSDKFYRIIIKNGFAENVNVPQMLRRIDKERDDLSFDMKETTFFLGKEQILPTEKEYSSMAKWRDKLFSVMVRNEQRATAFFGLPPDRVVEVGTQIKM